MNEFSTIGKSPKRHDAVEKVTGATKFVDDIHFGATLLYAQILRSPHAHAKIVSIDTSAAEQSPGVRAVVTGKEHPRSVGLYLADRPIYAVDKVRFVGEPVAGVAAETLQAAREAVKLIKVEYEELPGIFDPVSGAKKGAMLLHDRPKTADLWWQGQECVKTENNAEDTVIHENLASYSCVPFIFPVHGTNISNHFKIRKGDINKGFEEADVVIENVYTLPHIQHAPIEPHSGVGLFDRSGKLTLWVSSQSPNAVRKIISHAFDLPINKVRIIAPYVGGGFGGKAGVSVEGLVVPLAMKVPGYHIKLTLTREEVFQCTFVRQGLVTRLKTGARKDGRLVAQQCEFYWDGGAYNEYGVNITRKGGFSSSGPYEIPNMKTDSLCVYTNHPVGGPMRGFGMPEIHWAIEQQLDILAEQLGIDTLEIRRINALREGSKAAFGGPMIGATLIDTIDAVKERSGWGAPLPPASSPDKVRGRGIACMYKAPSMPPNAQSSAFLKFNEDGTVNILTNATEIGQGSHTALAQIAAEELGVPVESIRVNLPDTDYNPYEWQTVASRTSYSAGNAVLLAARDAKEQLIDLASRILGVNPNVIEIKDGHARLKYDSHKMIPIKEIAVGYLLPNGAIGGPVIGKGFFIPSGVTGLDPETGQGERPGAFWTFGTQVVDIEVDTGTGEIAVIKVTAAYEVGKVINPELCVGQVHGGILQGLGSALYEQLVLDKGRPLNNNFVDYKIPASTDTPQMDVIILETVPQVDGPFGVKGIAEPTMVPTAPAIANALYNALGIRIKDLPVTAEKVLAALKQKKQL